MPRTVRGDARPRVPPPLPYPVQNPFTQPRPVQGLPATLFGLPVAGVYALGAALAAALGFGGWSLAARLLPGALMQEEEYPGVLS